MKKLWLFFILIGLGFTPSCKKEKTTWNADWSIPLIHGKLTPADLVGESNFVENSLNYASLVYHDTVFSFSIDTLIKMPDTTLVKKSAISIGSVTMNPGDLISDSGIDQLYDLGDIELKRAIIKEGKAVIKIESPIQGKTKVIFTLANTTDADGAPFSRVFILPAGTSSNPTIMSQEVDIADFDFNFTGASGNLVNNITADIQVISNEETNSYAVTNTDTVIFSFEFKDLKPKYAKGYFGQHTLSDTASISIKEMKKIVKGQILLDSINLDLSLKNGFKLLANATFHQLKGINSSNLNEVSLSFPELNTSININPATGGLSNYQSSSYHLPIHSGNSNVISFIENLPDSIDIGYTLNINPYGNTGAGNDEFFPNSTFDLYLDGELPLKFSANDLTLVDTLNLSFKQNDNVILETGLITLKYTNSLPISSNAVFYILDENLNRIDSLLSNQPILPGTYDTASSMTTAVVGSTSFVLTESNLSNLEQSKQLVLFLSLSTDQTTEVKINLSDFFDFNLYSNLNLKFKL